MFSPLDLSSVGVSAYNPTMANGTAAVSRRNKDQPGPALSPTTSVRLLGIVEGIVPTDYPIEALRGMAVVVEPPELHE